MDQVVAGGDYGEKVQYKLFKFAEVNGEVSAQLVLEKVEKVIEGSGKKDRAIPVEDVEDGARKSEVGGLNYLGCPELKDRVDSEDNLEEGEGFSGWVVLEDVLTAHSEEGGKFGVKGK